MVARFNRYTNIITDTLHLSTSGEELEAFSNPYNCNISFV
jgi:hypothetical protein